MEIEIVTITTPACMYCGKTSQVNLHSSELVRLIDGEMIQDALPTRDASFRELVRFGNHPECWDAMMGPEED